MWAMTRSWNKIPVEYETVIGLEVHAQLLTKSKMFCACPADYATAPPNTRVCPICLGLPGALPVASHRAIKSTIMTGLALNCDVAEQTRFDRKNYFYPDLMKGYQISQYQMPIAHGGWLEIPEGGRVGIIRVHLEEDTAKLYHRNDPASRRSYSLVDVNRAGVPLMEIVSEPDLRSPEGARHYLTILRSILQFLGVSSGNMEEGAFRCDANVSIRPVGTKEFGVKVEIKNMNSFRAVYRALEFEVSRQRGVLSAGDTIEQETRGWNESDGATRSQRSKEFAHDYRYFPEPDLPPLEIGREWVDRIQAELPELPNQRRSRLVSQYDLSDYDAGLLTTSRPVADFYERTVQLGANPKAVANWMSGELFRLLNSNGTDISQSNTSPSDLAAIIELTSSGKISQQAAKSVLEHNFRDGSAPDKLVEELRLVQISDEAALASVVDEVVISNPKSVADYRAGKRKALGFLVGQAMKATRGKANPKIVNGLLRERLEGQG